MYIKMYTRPCAVCNLERWSQSAWHSTSKGMLQRLVLASDSPVEQDIVALTTYQLYNLGKHSEHNLDYSPRMV